ncbi:MAG: hypothetical protein M5U26_12085 [Planctomycetota bacterium]|nr:hypothetical protein [Planctomycetota bacterium]
MDGALRQAAGGSALRLRLDELKRLEDAYLSLEGSVREARALADRADRVEGDNAEASRLRRDGEERSARYAASRARARRLLADRPNADLAEERAKAREEVAALAARLDEARAYFNRRAAEDDKPVADFGIIRIGVEGDKKRAAKWRALGEDAAALKRRVEDVSP